MRERLNNLIRLPAAASTVAHNVTAAGSHGFSNYGLLWVALACGTGFFWYMSHSTKWSTDTTPDVAIQRAESESHDSAASEDKSPDVSLSIPVTQSLPTISNRDFDGPVSVTLDQPDESDRSADLEVEYTPPIDETSSEEMLERPLDDDETPEVVPVVEIPSEAESTPDLSFVETPTDNWDDEEVLDIEPINVEPFDETVTGFTSAPARIPTRPVDSSIEEANPEPKNPPQTTVNAEPLMTRDELIAAFGDATDDAAPDPTNTITTENPFAQSETKAPKTETEEPIMNLDHVASARDPFWWQAASQELLLETGPPQSLELNSALAFAIQLAPELQVLRADQAIAEQFLRQQEARFDWNTFLQSSWDQDSNPVGSILDGASIRLNEKNWSLRGGVRRTNQHGGQFELAQNFGYFHSNSSFIRPNNQGSGRLSFDYTHPLMRQRGILYNTSAIALAELSREIAHDDLMTGIENHLLDVADAYWNLVLNRGRLVQNKKAYDRAKKLFDSMSLRQQVDVRPNQLARAEASLLGNQSLLIEATHEAKRAQEILLRLIYGSSYTSQNVEVIPTTSVRDEVALSDPKPHVDDGLRNRSEIQAVLREIRAASLEHDLAVNEVLPMLNLVLSGYTAGLRGNSDVAGAFKNQFNSSEPGFGVGFEFEVPYRNRAAKAATDQRRIAIERFRKEFESVVADVTLDVRSQLVNVSRDTRLSQVRADAMDRTGKELEFLETRYKLLIDGTHVSDLYFDNLVQTQNRFRSAESSVLNARTQLARSQMQLLRGKGMMHTLIASQMPELKAQPAEEPKSQDDAASPSPE